MARTVMEKLGFKPGMTGWVQGCPDALAGTIALPGTAPDGGADLTLIFVRAAADVGPAVAAGLAAYRRGGSLWFAYPKKTGAIRTDISRDTGWEPAKAHDLLPVTQIALDDTWSALRFRFRDEVKAITRKF